MTEKSLKDIVTEYAQRCRFRVMKYFYSIENDVPSDPPSWNEYKVRPNVTSSEINLIENQQNSGPTLLSTLGRKKAASSSDAVRSDHVEFGMSSSSNVTSHPKRRSKSEENGMKSKEKKGKRMSRELHHDQSTKADLTLNVSSSAPLRKKCTNEDLRNDYSEFGGDEDNHMPASHSVTASFSGNSSIVLTRKTVNRSNNIMLHDGVKSRRPSTVRVRHSPYWNKDRSSNHIKPKLARVEKRKTEMVEKSALEKKPKLQTNALEGPDKKAKLRRDYRKESQEENQKLVGIGRESPLPNNKKQKSNAKEKESSPHHPDKQAKLVHYTAFVKKAEQRRDNMEPPIKEKKAYKLHPIASPRQGARGNKRKSAVHYLSQKNEKKLLHSSITQAIRGQDSVTTSDKKLKIQRKVFTANSGVKDQKTLETMRRSSPPHLNQQAREDNHRFTPVPKTQIQPALKAVGSYRKISGHHSKASPRQDIGGKETKTGRMAKNTRHHRKLQAHKAMTSSQDVEETQITTPIWKSVIKKRTEKWEELYKDPIQHAGVILTIPIKFRNQFKDEFEIKLIDQKADLNNLLPKDTIKLILNKYNTINNKNQSKLQTKKDIQHSLDMECSNYQNKPTYSKEFWEVSEHRVDFMPPEICPEHLHATKTQFIEYTELAKRVKEKKIQMAEEIGGLEKIVGLQTLITEAKETVEKGWTEMDSHTKSLLLQNAWGMKADVEELLKSFEK